jgi:hypothetical protein
MSGLGRKVFTAGEVLTAANVQDYLQDQAVMVFAGTAARGSALPGSVVSEGMVTYLSDTNTIQVATGTATWETVYPVSQTPTVTTIAATATAYTIAATDANDTIYSLATTAATVTITDVLSVGDRVDIWRDAAGTVIIAAGSGVTSWGGAGTAGTAVTFKIDQQYNAATVQKLAANTYRVVGKITV